MSKVKGVVLIVGKEDIPSVPRDENELRPWYMKVCTHAQGTCFAIRYRTPLSSLVAFTSRCPANASVYC